MGFFFGILVGSLYGFLGGFLWVGLTYNPVENTYSVGQMCKGQISNNCLGGEYRGVQ